jgi:hypothetical protein
MDREAKDEVGRYFLRFKEIRIDLAMDHPDQDAPSDQSLSPSRDLEPVVVVVSVVSGFIAVNFPRCAD